MTNPAEDAAPQPEVERLRPDTDCDFTVELPTTTGDRSRHVVRMHGDQPEFTDAYLSFVGERSEAAAALFVPMELRDLDEVRTVLDALGGAKVVSIETV